ncbi:hypothetical protein BJ546DRAFT_975518 [Cryomyces antarcticus]
MPNIVEQLDAKISEALSGWNLYTTVLALVVFAYIAYPIVFHDEPDTHPMLLARQASASPVRQPGESAVYRSLEVPHGYPLKTGLNVKEPDAPKWSGGKDGDLRDIWRQVAKGAHSELGGSSVPAGKILTVLGKEDIKDHDVGDISREINIIGKHIQQHGGTRVAIYLPNSIEFLSTVFACAFYGLSPILIPYNQPFDIVLELLQKTGADCLVAAAGALPLADVGQRVSSLKEIVWVVEKSSRQMDWHQKPEGTGNRVGVSVWHDLVLDQKRATSVELPTNEQGSKPANITTIWQKKQGAMGEVVEFTQQNMVAAIAAQISALPARQRMSPSDLFLPADAFTHAYVLTLTLAALFSHASIAITSVASPGVDLSLVTRNVAPTIIVASAETAASLHSATHSTATSGLKKFAYYTETKALAGGRMPTDTLLTRLNAPIRAAVGSTPGKLRLLFVSERVGAGSPPLTSEQLSDLRVFTGARVIYALTAAQVAGAVSQTSIFDYRREEGRSGKHSHFGIPLSSVEVKLVDTLTHRTTDKGNPEGEITVLGPAVAGGKAALGVMGTFRADHTLAYV